MVVSGRNHFGRRPTPYSYYFSQHLGCWGWATWRRAWRHFDMRITLWPELRDTRWLLKILGDERGVEYWRKIFDKAYGDASNVDYWDYQWTFACWAQNGLAAVSKVNLVENIGFGKGATHTLSVSDARANVPAGEMVFPLDHSPYMVSDRETDQLRLEQLFQADQPQPSLYRQLRRKIGTAIPDPIRKQILRLKA